MWTGTINSIDMKETAQPQHITTRADQTPFFKKDGDSVDALMRSTIRPFFTAFGVQAKYLLDQPGDPFEHQADLMADKVMRMPGPVSGEHDGISQTGEEEEMLQGKPLSDQITPLVQRQEMPEEEEMLQTRLENSVQRKCNGCGKELESKLQMKSVDHLQRKCSDCEKEEKNHLQTKAGANQKPKVESSIANQIDSITQSGGQPLSRSSRNFFESRFGYDFGGVRIHTGGQASESARNLGAQAYTVGNNIVFGSGKYAPGESSGKQLIAHELTHVVQQSGSGGKKLNRSKSRKKLAQPASDRTKKVQRKRMQIGDIDADFQPRVVLETAFQAPGGRVTARRGIKTDNNGHGVAQLDRKEEAVGLNINYTITWLSGGRKKPLPPGIPPILLDLCNPCLILESPAMTNALRFARRSIRDMAKDCRSRKTFKERKEFVKTFLELILNDPCLLIEETPLHINIPIVGRLGVYEACQVGSFIPIVSSIIRGASRVTRFALNAVNRLPAEHVCRHVPIIDPPDPSRPEAKGNATVAFITRFFAENGINGFGPTAITQQSGTGAFIEQPVASGRTKLGGRGVNVFLAPALLRAGAFDRGQDLVDIDVLLAAPPSPIDFKCEQSFFPFRINLDVFEDEPGQLEAIHQWYHGLHPRTKKNLADGLGLVEVIGRASNTGSFDFNMKLSEKRAKRVENQLRIAAGSDSHLRQSGTGFLAAAEPGESARERRTDVRATGKLEGDAALEVETTEGACVGGSVADTLLDKDKQSFEP